MADIRDQGQVNTPKVQADDGQSLQVSLRQDTSLSSVHTGSRQWYDPRIEAAPDEGYTQSPDISNSSENYNESVLQDGDSSVSNIELGGSGNNASSTKIVNNQAPISGNGQEIIETNSPPLQPVTQPDTGDTFGNGFGGGGGAGGTSGSGGSSAAARSVGGGGGGGGTTTIAGASADDAAAGASGSDVLSVNDVEGAGGENLTLNINVFEDNSTSIYIILIQGMPDGATLSAGDNLGNGIWQVSVDELDGLSVAITEETIGNYNVTVTVINTETGEVVDSESFELAANDGADAPTLSVDPTSGNEDSAIALDITAGLTDADETLSVTISDIPAGSTLSAGTVNPDGTVTLTAAELAGLTITPPKEFSGSFDLTVTATSTEGSDTASVSETLAVTVDAQADAPTLSVDPASGNEDSAIALDITAGLTDADETLSVTISDIPAGSTLSAGTVNPDGTVTLTAGELAGLTITPPEDFSGSFDLTVTATSSDGADTSSIADTLSVTVDPVADAPAVTVDIDPVIEENVPSDLTITLDPLEADVTAEITVTGLPADATLSAGTQNPDGSWTLSEGDLAGLTLTVSTTVNISFTVDVIVTHTINGTTDSTTQSATVDVVDAGALPSVTVSFDGAVLEDAATPLDISVAVESGESVVEVTVDGLPAGTTLSAGTVNPDGSVTLTPGELAGLTLTPPDDYNGSLDFTVTAETTSGAGTETVTENVSTTVEAVAGTPTLTVNGASGTEDGGAITLDITAGVTDTGEGLEITISDIPAGSTLSAGTVNPDGTVTLTAGELAGLTITPPEDFSGSFDLTVTATSSDGADTASIADTLSVTVDPVADAPTLSVDPASGNEDSAIALDITAGLTDADETLSVTISDIPAGATLSAGTVNPDGTVTLTAAELAGLTITPPEDFSGSFDLTVTATSSDGADTASVADTLSVTVDPVADAPTLSVDPASGNEDSAIALDITAGLTDADETLSVTISDIPAGATLSAGTVNPDGTVTLTAGELAGLTITPPEDFSGSFDLTVTATSSDGADTASIADTLSVTVDPVADAPTLSVDPASGNEDSAIALDITAGLTDADETLSVTISDIPAGSTLSAGTVNPDGTVTLTAGELAGLTITPPEDFSGSFDLTVTATSTEGSDTASVSETLAVTVDAQADAPTLSVDPASGNEDSAIALDITAGLTDADETLSVTISDIPAGSTLSAGTVNPDGTVTLTAGELAGLTITPPEDFSGSFDLTVTATSSDGADTASIADTLSVTVDPVADAPTLSVDPASGNEDSAIAFDITAGLTDADETLSVTISDIPAGSTLSAGTVNPDGTVTLTAAELAGLTITPPEDFSGSFDLTVTATSSDGADTASVADTLSVTVDPVADATTLSVDPASGNEDSAIALDITAGLTDADETLSVTISDIPAGSTLSAGTVNPDGTVTLTAGELAGLTITPPEDFSGSFDLTVTATSSDGADTASIADTLSVTVDPVADAPTLSVDPASGNEDSAIALDITAGLTDADETLSVTISDIPAGATLSAGTVNPDGTVTLTAAELAGLTISPPEDFSGSFDLTVTATSSDGADTASIADTLSVTVDPVADAPTLSVDPASGNEDSAIALDITAGLTDADETLSVTISDIPAGSTLSAGTVNPDGTVTLTAAELAGLTITPPEDFSGSFDLTVTATSSDGADTASIADTLSVTVDPVADAPTLSVDPATGNEDSAIALDITAGLTDADETLSVTISDIPAGATLSAGTVNPDGTVTLTAGELAGLTITPPEDFSGSFDLTVTATSSDGADTASIADTLSVTVDPVADAPTLSVDPATGNEDSAIALDITAGLTDADETLSVTISDIPAGSTLSAGTVNPDSTVTLTAAELASLTITPPEDFSGSFDLTVTATSSDGADTASIADTLSVTVDPVADAPTLSVDPASGNEDSAIALDITAGLTDADESLSVTISDIPAGSTLSAGTVNPDGTVTLTAAELAGLTITPPADYYGSFDLTVTATSVDGSDSASVSETLTVQVENVADGPELTLGLPALCLEDTACGLTIDVGVLAPSEVLEVTIEGLPNDATLSAGIKNPDGSWTLTQAELVGLTVTVLEPGDSLLTVTATVNDPISGTSDSTIANINLEVLNVAEGPTLNLGLPALCLEDTAYGLTIDVGVLAPSEVLEVTIEGLPNDATLSAGIKNPDGSWTLTQAELVGLTVTVLEPGDSLLTVTATVNDPISGTSDSTIANINLEVLNVAEGPTLNLGLPALCLEDTACGLTIDVGVLSPTEVLEVTIEGLPNDGTLSAGIKNPDGSWTLTQAELVGLTVTVLEPGDSLLTVTATVNDPISGTSDSTIANINLEVLNVAEGPTLNLGLPALCLEDTACGLTIDVGVLAPSEVLEVTIEGLPNDATLSAGIKNPDGSWTLTQAELVGLTVTVLEPGDSLLTVTATVNDPISGTSDSTIANINLEVLNVAEGPTLNLGLPALCLEDTACGLTIDVGVLAPSEVLEVTIEGLPNDGTLSAGIKNPDGSWTLTQAELVGLTVTVLEPGDSLLTVTATVNDPISGTSDSTIANINLEVLNVAEGPTLNLGLPALCLEDTACGLTIDVGVLSPTEVLEVTIEGLPNDATLSAGIENPDGSWTLTQAELVGLTVTALEPGDSLLTVTATVSDPISGTSDSTIANINLEVLNIADAPTLDLSLSAAVIEDSPTPLLITVSDLALTEDVTLTIDGVDNGATLNAGTLNPDGTYTLELLDLVGLAITPDTEDDLQLSITATVEDSSSNTVATTTATLDIDVLPNPLDPLI
ncbi:MAG: Ig-like domain-containing protein [Pseudomonadota bacterium]|nr:Ig-like domain-containing protein [Pseudomonadota bacterium]